MESDTYISGYSVSCRFLTNWFGALVISRNPVIPIPCDQGLLSQNWMWRFNILRFFTEIKDLRIFVPLEDGA